MSTSPVLPHARVPAVARRRLVAGVAWSVPVVAMASAAPAFAASPCQTTQSYRLDWGGSSTSYARTVSGGTQTGTATITGLAGTTPVVVTFTSTVQGSMVRATDNLQLSAETNVGGLNQGRGLNIAHQDPIPSGSANRQQISISFSRAVTGLAFVVTDLDASQGGWDDMVALTPLPSSAAGPNVQGGGTLQDPWNASVWGNVGNSSNQRNLSVAYSGTIAANTPLVLSFWSASGNSNQRIFLSDFTFSARGC